MSDLVQRLRSDEWGPYATERREAADEIEQLIATCMADDALIKQQQAEIERLRAVVDAAKGVTEYGEVAFMGVNIPFKSFRKLKEALAALEGDE